MDDEGRSDQKGELSRRALAWRESGEKRQERVGRALAGKSSVLAGTSSWHDNCDLVVLDHCVPQHDTTVLRVDLP